MKNSATISLILAIVIMNLAFATATQRRTLHLGHYFKNGACSTRLMDALRHLCGSSGVKLMRNMYLMMRYRPKHLQNRRRYNRRSRSKRSDDDLKEFHSLSFTEALAQSNNGNLNSFINTGSLIHHERVKKSRARRQIAHECCENDCDMYQARINYCRWKYA